MSHHLIVGAGGIGRATARHLVDLGHEVTMLSRRGSDPGIPGVRAAAGDAADAAAILAAAGSGTASIVNAVNPSKYTAWERDWPPVASALLAAAERAGAGLVTVGNLYGYGRVDGPMTEQTPLRPNGKKGEIRARMWRDALAAHEAGRLRATELRASDYFGPDSTQGTSYLNSYVIAPAAAGKGTVRLVMGDPDAPHSWTYLPDIGALAARLATDDRSWGRVWHVPTAAPRTLREVAADAAAVSGHLAPEVRPWPGFVKRLAHVVPLVRELDETSHQFERPFVLDSSAATTTFGLEPTDWSAALKTTVAALQG